MLRRVLYFFYDLLILKRKFLELIKEYHLIQSYMYFSLKDNINLQKIRLFNILDFSIKNVPYYRKIANQRNISISKTSIFEDIQKFPILTKEIIRKNWKALHPNLSQTKFVINTSGGTTGEPIKIIQDRYYSLKTYAANLIFDELGEYKAGEKVIKLWGNEKEIIMKSKSLLHKIINIFFKNMIFQNSFKMSEKTILKYINEINQIKPEVIIAYVQSIYEMAKFIKRKDLKIHKLKSIITSAGVLTKKVKNFIEEIFKCRVYNRYGSREVGLIAMSCAKSNSLHINMYHQYLEILGENNTSAKENKKGNIIITSLINFGMPLIRYKIGDIGSFDNSKCYCGRKLIKLKSIYGRTVGIFKNEKGDLIDGEYFTHLFYFMENLKRFQIVQEEVNLITIFLVMVDNNYLDHESEEGIKSKIKIVMGNNCKVNLNYVNKIEVNKSGKLQYTISKIL